MKALGQAANGFFHSSAEERNFAVKLGGWIYQSRTAMKLSQEDMGVIAGVHRNTIFRWERGETMPNPHQLARLKNFVKGKLDGANAPEVTKP